MRGLRGEEQVNSLCARLFLYLLLMSFFFLSLSLLSITAFAARSADDSRRSITAIPRVYSSLFLVPSLSSPMAELRFFIYTRGGKPLAAALRGKFALKALFCTGNSVQRDSGKLEEQLFFFDRRAFKQSYREYFSYSARAQEREMYRVFHDADTGKNKWKSCMAWREYWYLYIEPSFVFLRECIYTFRYYYQISRTFFSWLISLLSESLVDFPNKNGRMFSWNNE